MPSELIHLLPSLLVDLIISNWLGYACSTHTFRFSLSPQLAHLTYFAILSLSFVSRSLLMEEVWLLLLFHLWEYGRRSVTHSAAAPRGTVKFTSPLYRKNLHYKVRSKPAGSVQVVREMVKYILENHKDETGIVYCLSRAVSGGFRAQICSPLMT